MLTSVEIKYVLVFETPCSATYPNVWLEGKKLDVGQACSISSFDVLAICLACRNAMPDVLRKIQVLKSITFDLSICPAKQFVECRVRIDEACHSGVEGFKKLFTSGEFIVNRISSIFSVLDEE